jgi:hypothetical protein
MTALLLDNSWLLLAATIAGAMAISAVGVRIAARWFPSEILRRHHDVTTAMFGVVGVVYAVLLAFVVLIVWQEYNDSKRTVEHEQAVARTLMRSILRYPEPDRTDMRQALAAYVTSVAEIEFPAMVSGDRQAIRDNRTLDRLWDEIEKASRVEGPRVEALYGTILDRLNELGIDRSQRLRAARDSIPWAIWVVLLLGGTITVGFSLMFVSEIPRYRFAMVAGLTLSLALVIYTVALLDHPFHGSIRIEERGYTSIAKMEGGVPPVEAVVESGAAPAAARP